MNDEKYDELDKRHDELIGELTDLEWDIIINLSSLIEINFDSDTNIVDVAIKRLRSKVDTPFDSKLIHTVRGFGYVLEKR